MSKETEYALLVTDYNNLQIDLNRLREDMRKLAYEFGKMGEDALNLDGDVLSYSERSALKAEANAFDIAMTMLCERLGVKVSELFQND